MPKLCLTRRAGERIAITLPDDRVVWVAVNEEHRGCKVRLVIDAPPDILVDREEVRELRLARKGVAQ